MKKNIEKKIFAAIFLLFLFGLGGLSSVKTITDIKWDLTHKKEESESLIENLKTDVNIVNDDIADNIFAKYQWIECYGAISRAIGKKEVNGFSYGIDKNGAYEPINFWVDADETDFRNYAQQLVLFRDDVEKNGGHFLFLLFPHKMNESWNEGYKGLPYNDFNEQADALLEWLEFYGVDYIDFRETMKASNLSFEEMFYKTDHHWTGYAAFLAFQELVDHMNTKYDAGLDPEGFYTDVNNYEIKRVENTFLGSAGRNVGTSFAKTDLEDFQTVTPLFNTNLQWTTHDESEPPASSLIMKEMVTYEEPYKSDAYKFYMNGVNTRDQITNFDNPDGPTMFFIRDSYASPIIMDMLPMFSEIDCSWGKYTSDRYVKNDVIEAKPDYVLVGYYPEDLTEEFFKFYKEDVEKYKLDYAKSQGFMEEGE